MQFRIRENVIIVHAFARRNITSGSAKGHSSQYGEFKYPAVKIGARRERAGQPVVLKRRSIIPARQ